MRNGVRQDRGEALSGLIRRQRNPEVPGLGHAQARVAAGIDCVERRKIHVDIERETVKGAPSGDPNAERRDLGVADVYARRAGPAQAGDTESREQIDHGPFHQADKLAHLDRAPAEVDQRVEHDLARAVVGDLAPALATSDRQRPGLRSMRRIGRMAQRIDRRMFEQPKLVRCPGIAVSRKAAHRLQGRQILHPSEALDDQRGCAMRHDGRHHSTITTLG